MSVHCRDMAALLFPCRLTEIGKIERIRRYATRLVEEPLGIDYAVRPWVLCLLPTRYRRIHGDSC